MPRGRPRTPPPAARRAAAATPPPHPQAPGSPGPPPSPSSTPGIGPQAGAGAGPPPGAGPTVPLSQPTGQPYGQNQALTQVQQATPIPDEQARYEQAISQLSRMQPPTQLAAPTERPGVPLQNGLPSGPGAGPEALRMNQGPKPMPRMADLYAYMASVTGNEAIARAADAAATQGM